MGLTRKATNRELEIRNENRYTLHPQEKKRCTQCEIVYDDIETNFDIHHKQIDGRYGYSGQCKHCLQTIRADRKDRRKRDVKWYGEWLLAHIRFRAKNSDLAFSLTAQFLFDLWVGQNGKCFYTGEEMDFFAVTSDKKSPHKDFPSLDRMIPNVGYTEQNVVWCKWGVNRMKNDLTKDEFVAFCLQVIKNVK